MSDGLERLRSVLARLPDEERDPHPRAAGLVMPDGTPAPTELRLWAGVARVYPSPLASRRSDVAIADDEGVVAVRPMREVLRAVCIDDVRGELDEDPDTLAYLETCVERLARELAGSAARLAPSDHPDCVLWLPPGAPPMLIWYENDRFDRREPFATWLAELLEEDEAP